MCSKQRLRWIDYSKGIGILLVLIAHALEPDNIINIYSYSFHLPLFFMLSGLTIKTYEFQEAKINDVVKKNIKAIIVPYYFYTAFIAAIELIKNVLQNDVSIKATMDIVLRWAFLCGIKADWFLPCLFFAKILFLIIYRQINNVRLVCGVTTIIAFVAMYFPFKPHYQRPLMCSLIAVFFVALGYSINKKYIVNVDNGIADRKKSVYIKVAVIIAWIVITSINGKVSLLAYNFGASGLLYLINGILGSIVVMIVMQVLDNRCDDIKTLAWLGKNSMIIMVVHMEIMAFLNAILNKIEIVNFNLGLLKTSLIITTLIFSVLVTPLINKIYNYLFKNIKR